MVVLFGTPNDDLLIATAPENEIHGNLGDDVIFGGYGFDVIFGGEGDDIIDGVDGPGKLHGGPGNDKLTGKRGGILGGEGNDEIVALAQRGLGQLHIYGMGGNDAINLDFGSFFGDATEEPSLSFGHHARGDSDNLGNGFDTFDFQNVAAIENIVVGRLEDFDPSRDELRVEGELLRFDHGRPILKDNKDLVIKVVGFKGNFVSDTPESQDDAQQWLVISNSAGGQIAYSLEGARVVKPGTGSANSMNQESHFVTGVHSFENFSEVMFTDPQNSIPPGFDDVDGVTITDVDVTFSDSIEPITGTVNNDVIAAGLNNDTVFGYSGDDRIWGGTGHDTIYGGDGNDLLFGSSGNDSFFGEGGADWITSNGKGVEKFDGGAGKYDTVSYAEVVGESVVVTLLLGTGTDGAALNDSFEDVENLTGSSQNDILHGNQERNILRGLYGDDRLKGNGGNDTLIGGRGNDTIDGGSNYDYAVFDGLVADFLISEVDNFVIVEDRNSADGNQGTDRLSEIEVVVFDDYKIFLADYF